MRGSSNVWSKEIEANFHLTTVACAAANGFIVPPLFIVPGQRLSRCTMDACMVPEACITTAPKGFMNSSIFIMWLEHFERQVPGSVRRPLVLVYDGYGSHYNNEIVNKAIELRVILVLLPANATHLIQPLDIAVFKPFKSVLKKNIETFMIRTGQTSIGKKDAIEINSTAWIDGIVRKEQNVVNGFRGSGIWPVSFPTMQHRLALFRSGGVNSSQVVVQPWIVTRQVIRNDILSLPAPVDNTRKRRKTLDCNNRLLTREQLQKYDE